MLEVLDQTPYPNQVCFHGRQLFHYVSLFSDEYEEWIEYDNNKNKIHVKDITPFEGTDFTYGLHAIFTKIKVEKENV